MKTTRRLAPGSFLFSVALERETGFEPATSTLARLHSTTELLPQTISLRDDLMCIRTFLTRTLLRLKVHFNRGAPFLLALFETVKSCALGGCLFDFQEYSVGTAASDSPTVFREFQGDAAQQSGRDTHD